MKKFYSILIFSIFAFLSTGAQDIHYTQFYNSPLTLNPALTGVVQGSYRIEGIYRNQWFTGVNNGFFHSPFQTPSISFDMPILLKNKDAVGVGIMILDDVAGAGSISTFTAQVSGSYIKHFGPRHQLSAGFQVGFTQTKLNGNEAQFPSQFDGNEFNSSLASGVALLPNVKYVNLNVGILYYGKLTDKISLYGGGAFFNTTVPKYNLVVGTGKKTLDLRGTIHGGLDFTLGRRFHILPSCLWMRQSIDNELNTGLGFGYDFTARTNLTIGFYNRANDIISSYHQLDALIAYVGLQVKSFKAGVSYDFTMTHFSEAGTGTGGLEISLIYIRMPKVLDENKMMFTPRF